MNLGVAHTLKLRQRVQTDDGVIVLANCVALLMESPVQRRCHCDHRRRGEAAQEGTRRPRRPGGCGESTKSSGSPGLTIKNLEGRVDQLETKDTPILKGYQLFHNYIRPHIALDGRTPAEAAGITIEGENKWLTLIQNSSIGTPDATKRSRRGNGLCKKTD